MGALRETSIKSRIIRDKILKRVIVLLSVLTILPIVLIIYELVSKGMKQLSFNFLFKTTPNTYEAMLAKTNGELIPGGIINGITGTLLMIILASIIAIPMGITAGVYLYENPKHKFASIVRSISDIFQGVPSIVLGLISYLWIVVNITKGYSALAGSVALAIMMLPMIVKSTEETLRMIPNSIREAAIALGVPKYKVILKVLVPTSFSGITTGILLSVSRILGETAPLMLTALGSSVVNWDITKPTSALPLLIWEFYNDPNMVDLIWSTSLLLMIIVLIFNISAKKIAQRQ